MPFYHSLGSIPPKRHTQFRRSDGSLYKEEVMGLRGFSGIQSILYHLQEPTKVLSSTRLPMPALTLAQDLPLQHRHLTSMNLSTTGDFLSARTWLLLNNDLKIGIATPTTSADFFYRNGSCDELLFVHSGDGVLRTQFGKLHFKAGDYVVIPVGTTYQLSFSNATRLLLVESRGRIEVPKRYRNEYGQFLEHAPFCERDIRVPRELETIDQKGEFEIRVRVGDSLSSLIVDHHPFDVVGWDGLLYPWIFNIGDFEPITGRIHQPPPVHQTFYADGFVVCSFVPRLFDYHPQAIPVPYNHSNVNSDEVLYYVAGDFMSRKGVGLGSFTHHPAGLPHGPHPGTVEKSLGQRETKELAVMIDTHAPLSLTAEGAKLSDPGYLRSWI